MEGSFEVLRFWFSEIPSEKWWKKDPSFDDLVRQKFSGLHRAATAGELFGWRSSIRGRLAEIIILDQFSRNISRCTAAAYLHDAQALCLAQEAARIPERHGLSADERAFLYMPFMHSESLFVHEESVRLFSEPGLEKYLSYERSHRNLIACFGRFPHRNAALGRSSTAEEVQYLAGHADY